jgi:ribose transport system substrate-binding protein
LIKQVFRPNSVISSLQASEIMRVKMIRIVLSGISVGISLLFILIALHLYSGNKEVEPKKVSVILYGNTIDRWESLKQGIDQAGKDIGTEINYVLMSTQHNKDEQLLLIQREIDNGADGILLAANDSTMDLGSIRKPSKSYPIVCIESGVANDSITLVSADNYTMGEELAKVIKEEENAIAKIAIIMDNQQRDSVEMRFDGFYNKITEKFYNLTYWNREQGENRPMIFAQRELTQEAVDVVAALDNSSLEAVIDATINLNKKVKIYGIANSDKAVYYLDNGRIKSLVYQDEFSIGYIGLKRLLGLEQYNEAEIPNYIKYHVVNDANLYLPDNQRALFPFVK